MITTKGTITGKLISNQRLTGNIITPQGIKGELGNGILYILPEGVVTTAVVDELPEPTEEYRGHFRIVEKDATDKLYVCLKKSGVYKWIDFSGGGNLTLPLLDMAMLDIMILN